MWRNTGRMRVFFQSIVRSIVLVLMVYSSQIHAQSQFVKFKKFLIPFGNSCNPFDAHKTGVPTIFYMNDIGLASNPGSDPDGVFDLPIIMAWHKEGRINLVGVGSSNDSVADDDLIETLMEESVEQQHRVAVTSKDDIPDKLISLSQTENCLHIAIGGPWEQLSATISQLEGDGDPDSLNRFVSNVSVSAIGGFNIGVIDNESPIHNPAYFDWYIKVRDTFGLDDKLVRLDLAEFSQSYPNQNSTDLNLSVLNTRSLRIARDDWFDTHFLDSTQVGRFIKNYGTPSTNFIERNDTRGTRFLHCNNTSGPACLQKYWGDVDQKGMKMRIADFNSVAYLIWGVDPNVIDFSSSMEQKLESAWDSLIP